MATREIDIIKKRSKDLPPKLEQTIYCEMEPGTALFFHGNVLHASAANTSPNPRPANLGKFKGGKRTTGEEPVAECQENTPLACRAK